MRASTQDDFKEEVKKAQESLRGTKQRNWAAADFEQQDLIWVLALFEHASSCR